ncbi:hypothetical protein BJ138DRAFT_1117381 [Hygrophoropsis aurantiaca]|uniref:Uncharacterized protein n=1 Tax=Hygrophoropsis aurantiaca TaxID=72124 RepID=A0ACB8A099_9AGAM|nr:hypothetical protein BJ138DRAFT_1117381 [Hygrophoropsis aurantiaca]
MYRQLVAFAAVLFAGYQGAFAQNSSVGVCLASTGFNWTTNSMNQSPCQVANNLFAADPCNQSGISYPALTAMTGPSSYYNGPSIGQQTMCTCSTVIYALTSACALCQNGTFLGWSAWIGQCPAANTVYMEWPASIPSDTAIPPWAYLPLYNGQFSNVQGQDNASAVAVGATRISSSTASSSTTSSAVTIITTSTTPASSGTSMSLPSASQSASPTGAGTGGADKMTARIGGAFAGALLLSFHGVF